MKRLKFLWAVMLSILAVGASSCVHQWPNPEYIDHNVLLTVHCDTEWLPDYEMTLSRADESGDVKVRYRFVVFPAGYTYSPVADFTVYKTDMSRQDFTQELSLPPGDYDVWAWSDICDADGSSLFYDDSDLAAITFKTPYAGDSNEKDAFRGMTSFSVERTVDEGPSVEARIDLSRPLARYIIIANDLEYFLEKEVARGRGASADLSAELGSTMAPMYAHLADYTVKIVYPMYLPWIFNNYQNNPFDSATGVSFECKMSQLSETEAQIALDYVMVNGEESSVQMQVEIYDATGELVSRSNVITAPTKRDRTTIIYGKFLTTLTSDGVGIDPGFDGDYNIEIK